MNFKEKPLYLQSRFDLTGLRKNRTDVAEIAQLVEHQLPKLRAAGSNPVFRSNR